MQRLIFILGFLILTCISCSEQPAVQGTLTKLSSDWNATVYLIDPLTWSNVASSYVGTVIDSAQVQSDGTFVFETLPEADRPHLYELAVQRKGAKFLNKLDNEDLATSNYMPIIWEQGTPLRVMAEAPAFQSTFSIENPKGGNAVLLELRTIREQAFKLFLTEKQEAAAAHDLLAEEHALLRYQQQLMKVAEETNHLLPALTAIRWISPEGVYERIPEFMVAQTEKWKGAAPNHPWTAQLAAVGSRDVLPVLIGDQLPDYALPMLSGDTIRLHQLLGDRLTILDLWASWCAPCRKENRQVLAPLWDAHHQSGLNIIGYALESDARVWTNAIGIDGADRWQHASHLNGDDAPLFEVLRLQTIPANFVLDDKGNVLTKNLHGDTLLSFVENYLK